MYAFLVNLLFFIVNVHCMEQSTPQLNSKVISADDRIVFELIKSDADEDTIRKTLTTQTLKDTWTSFNREIEKVDSPSYKNALNTLFAKCRLGKDVTKKYPIPVYQALYAASHRGYLNIVKFLLFLDADVNANYGFGQPLLWGVGSGHTPVVRLLIKAGADVNAHHIQSVPPSANNKKGFEIVTPLSLAKKKTIRK